MTAPSADAPVLDLNLGDFRSWLEKQRNSEVGMAAEFCDCPIATWLRSQGRRAVVSNTTAMIDGREVPLPHWAVAFIRELDFTFGFGACEPVTGREALDVLNEAEA